VYKIKRARSRAGTSISRRAVNIKKPYKQSRRL